MAVVNHLLAPTLMTWITYVFGLKLFQTFKKGWLHPLYTGTAILLILVLAGEIQYEKYEAGTSFFNLLLETATVSFAVPLYRQRKVIRKYVLSISIGLLVGAIGSLLLTIVLGRLLFVPDNVLLSLIPKSVTMPVALSLSETIGGVPSLTGLFVLAAGLVAYIVGPFLLNVAGIKSQMAKGLAMGSAAHALGASKALEWGEEEGALGSVALSLSVILYAAIIPTIASFLPY